MNISNLYQFITVVEEKSFSKAAAKLYTSQPALSSSIKALEKELGSTLLLRGRGSKEISLTSEGTFVYLHACNIMQERNAIFLEMKENNNVRAQIGVPAIIGANLFPNIIKYMDPAIIDKLEFVEAGSAKMHRLLEENRIDIAMLGSLTPTVCDNYDQHFIMKDRYAIFTSQNHPLAGRHRVAFSELQQERFISLGEDYLQYRVLKNLCLKEGMADRIHGFIVSNEFETVNSLISHGLGIGIMTTYSKGSNNDLAVIPLEEECQCYYHIAIKRQSLTPFEKIVKRDMLRALAMYKRPETVSDTITS